MPVQHVNRKGKTYYLHQGKTKSGNPKYFFSMKSEGTLSESIPEGYEIYENPNAQIFLRRIQPQYILDSEKALIEKYIGKIKSLFRYMIDIKGKIITIFESQEHVHFMKDLFEHFPFMKSIETSDLVDKVAYY